MIVDKERKVIYLHNPKCGGTFLRDLYIEKYGISEATKWWKGYTRTYGTDLGHITYSDLPRFIREWKEYRIVVMVRNPYNRFYSAVKEAMRQYVGSRITVSVYGFRVNVPCYVYYGEYQEWNKIRKIYELWKMYAGIHLQDQLKLADPEEFCKRILLKHSLQKSFIRNKRIPWLNPQSYFWGKGVEVFYYESDEDWKKLLDAFGLLEYQSRLSIAKDYIIPDYMHAMIEKLYPEDMELFRKYKY